MNADEVCARARVTPEDLAAWRALGLLAANGDEFTTDAVERARLIRDLTARGITAEQVAQLAEATGDVLGRFLSFVESPEGPPRAVAEAAEEVGLPTEFVRRLLVSAGLSKVELHDDDVGLLRGVTVARAAGLPDEAIVQMVRVMSDAMSRVADAQARLFHFYVHERLRAEGLYGAALGDAISGRAHQMDGLIETAVVYLHRKAWPRALREDLLLHLVEEVDPEAGASGQLPVAVLFVDVAGYTTLTEEVGDLAAAAMLDRFSAMVRELVDEADGRIIKQIGDEFMVVFPNGSAAVMCGLAIADRALAERDFPALRLGAHTGTALYREADYVGATVNAAARIAGQATAGQFLISEALRSELGDLALDTRSLGERRLKGFSKPFELFEVSAR